jgi:manganese transport protein
VSALFGGSIVIACIATDVAELLGGALGFQILFGLPLMVGAVITAVLQILLIMTGRYRHIERIVIAFIGIIALCYVVELALVNPDWKAAAQNWFVPSLNSASILVAIGMLGAVVMPHNVYLHSNVVLEREQPHDTQGKRRRIRYEFGDTTLAMILGWMINSAMVIVAAAVFFDSGVTVDSLPQASATLEPLAGSLARLLFGIGLLFAGLGSSFTSAMAEVNVLTAYLGRPEDPRTKLYRAGLFVMAIPALAVVAAGRDPLQVLIYSQVALTIQLPLTIIPLLWLVFSKKVMGDFRSGPVERILAITATLALSVLNTLFLYTLAGGSF